MDKHLEIPVLTMFLIDDEDQKLVLEQEWIMDIQGNVYTTVEVNSVMVKCTIARFIMMQHCKIGIDERVGYKSIYTKDNRKQNLEIVKRKPKSDAYPPSTPIPDSDQPLPKYVYKRGNKYAVFSNVSGVTKYISLENTIEQAIAKRQECEKAEAYRRINADKNRRLF